MLVRIFIHYFIVGDVIASVNGINTSRLRHEDIINLLKNVGDVLNLGIEYELPPANQANQHQVQKIVQVTYSQSESEHSGGLGFVLRGGNVPTDTLKSRPLAGVQNLF